MKPEAAESFAAYVETPGAIQKPAATRLGEIVREPKDAWASHEVAKLLGDLGFHEVALLYQTDTKEIIASCNESLAQAWGPNQGAIRVSQKGLIHLEVNTHGPSDLSALAGMPIESLRVASPVADLTPIGTLKNLRELQLDAGVKATDTSPLAGLRLQRLQVHLSIPMGNWNCVRGMDTCLLYTSPSPRDCQ